MHMSNDEMKRIINEESGLSLHKIITEVQKPDALDTFFEQSLFDMDIVISVDFEKDDLGNVTSFTPTTRVRTGYEFKDMQVVFEAILKAVLTDSQEGEELIEQGGPDAQDN